MVKNNSKKNLNNTSNVGDNANITLSGIKWHYSLITILLIVFIAHLAWGVVSNTAKVYSLQAKIAKLEAINKIAVRKNTYLREELEKYSSDSGVEALARDRLKFSKEDETLVIIKK